MRRSIPGYSRRYVLREFDVSAHTEAGFLQMIMVASPDKPFTYTAKGTTRRQTIIADYAAEIDALYASVKTQSSYDIPLPASWDTDETLIYVRQLVTTVLNRQLADDADIFQYGCDRRVR